VTLAARAALSEDNSVTTTVPPTTVIETAFAAEQKQHLVRTLRRFDMVFFTVAVIVGLDLIGQAASNGYEALTWTVVLVVLFLVPYGLVMAEVGSAFTAEGGPYEWVKLTMGRFWAGLNTIFYWVTNPLWVGGSLAFIGTAAWSSGVSNIGGGSAADYLFKLLFVWGSISSAIISFRIGKWIPTLGALLKVVLVAFFALTVLIYGFDHGFQGVKLSQLSPTSAGLLAIAPLILFSFVGFEGQNGAAEEMVDPQRDVPQSILRSGALSAFCYLTPTFLVLLVLPASKISGLGGFLDAVKASYTIYGGAAHFMYGVTCVLFILTLMNSGSAWMMRRSSPRCRCRRRRLLSLLRRVSPDPRHPVAGKSALGGHRHGLLLRRDPVAELGIGIDVRRRAEHRDLHDADLLHPDLSGGVPVAPPVPRRTSAVPPRAQRQRSHGGLSDDHHVVGPTGLVDVGLPGDAQPPARAALLLPGLVGGLRSHLHRIHARDTCGDRGRLRDRVPERQGCPP